MDNEVKTKKKYKRHFLLVVPVIMFAIMLFGSLLSMIGLSVADSYITDSAWYFVLEAYGTFTGVIIVLFIYLLLAERDILKTLWYKGQKGNTFKGRLIGLLIGFGMNLVCGIVAMLNKDIYLSFDGIDVIYLIYALIFVTIQSSCEEALCRGYLHFALKERYGLWVGLIVNSGIFAALHLGNPGMGIIPILEIRAIGVFLTLITEYQQSFWMACMIHTGWNFMQNFILGLPNSGLVSERAIMRLERAKDSLLYSTAFGIEGGLPSVIVSLIGIIVVVLLHLRKKNNNG